MRKLNSIWIVLLLAILLGCSDNSTNSSDDFEEASSQKQFVWNAMNYWYYWQDDVPNLADDRFSNDQEFNEYLNGFSDAEAVFNTLLYNLEDDFSFFIEDYETFQQSQQGISESFGYEFGLVRLNSSGDDIFGYVQYVLPDSPAQEAGLERGDLWLSVDGTQMTVNNYRDLLLNRTSYELGLAEIENNTISETGETVSLEAVTIQEDPVFISTILDTASTSVGYLMYNSFQRNSHQRLNEVFGTFQSEGIDELILDLRYNSGGAGITSQMLASMISGLNESNLFATYSFNSKRAEDNNRSVSFLNQVPLENGETEPMNKLSLDRVYILTGSGTASASEVLLNGLEAYIEVIQIGRQTVGKDDGSYTLYDSPAPYYVEENANPDHKIAIQPIVLKVVNVDGRDYPDGFTPASENQINELGFLEDLPPLGDPGDPLLARALELITGEPVAKAKATSLKLTDAFNMEMLINSRELKPYSNVSGYTVQPDQLEIPEFQ